MTKQYYTVIEEFDSQKDYGFPIREQYAKCLSVLKKGQKINLKEFIKQHFNEFTRKPRSYDTNREVIYHSFGVAKKIGVVEKINSNKDNMPFKEFCKLNSVQYYIEQLRGSRYKNMDPKRMAGTASMYSGRLWNFNSWITGREIEITLEIQTGENTYQKKRKSITISNVQHILELYQHSYKEKLNFIRIIKEYFLDPIHEGKRASTLKIDYCAIRAYFDRNDSPLDFKVNLSAKYQTVNDELEQAGLSLDEFMMLLNEGKPSLTQKAVFLCKFHRGLDTSTFVDRFNFQAWQQLVEYFGTSKYKEWDLSKCPVPIRLTRMKTDYPHTGFLDKDAIFAIQKYLDYRNKKTGNPIEIGHPLFLNSRNEPITNNWIENSLKRLAENSGLKKEISGYMQTRYRISSHEVRDLLKSTLIDSGTRYDLADHFIGHKPKDSYEKQTILYTDTMREEYAKASNRINVFSNFSNFVKGHDNSEILKKQITKLEEQQKVHIETQKTMLAVLREKQIIP